TVTFTVLIENQGQRSAPVSMVNYFIDDSSSPYFDSDSVSSLVPNQITDETFKWTMRPGFHTVTVVVDSGHAVPESVESNNELIVTVDFPFPDIVVTSILSSPENPSVGEIVTFTMEIENQGRGNAPVSTIDYFIEDWRHR
ncbi:MAG: hypothetical protein IIC51_09865, partial [Planctomycetes bacterium]|nr:hypothetical protein [Planctomycetota bacterium]